MKDKRLIILAAGTGTRLMPLTENKPKAMVPLHGKPLVNWQINAAREAGIQDIVLVGGYHNELLEEFGLPVVRNERFAETNMVTSLWCASEWFGDGFVMAYGDIVYNPEVLKELLTSPHDLSVVVDREWKSYWQLRMSDILQDAESLEIDEVGRISSIGQKVSNLASIQGQYIGMVAFRGEGLKKVCKLIEEEKELNRTGKTRIHPVKPLDKIYMTDLLQGMINNHGAIYPVWINGGWMEVDNKSDLALAEKMSVVENSRLSIRRG